MYSVSYVCVICVGMCISLFNKNNWKKVVSKYNFKSKYIIFNKYKKFSDCDNKYFIPHGSTIPISKTLLDA